MFSYVTVLCSPSGAKLFDEHKAAFLTSRGQQVAALINFQGSLLPLRHDFASPWSCPNRFWQQPLWVLGQCPPRSLSDQSADLWPGVALKVFLELFRLTSRAILSGHGIRWEMHNIWLIMIILYIHFHLQYILFLFQFNIWFHEILWLPFRHLEKIRHLFRHQLQLGWLEAPPNFEQRRTL